jgi:hypothetical protein
MEEEKVKKMNVEELMRFLERGGVYALLAAEEGLRRFEKGDYKIGKNFLISVLRAKIKGKMEKKGKELKKMATQILIEKFFDEKSVEEIVDCEDLEKKEKEKVAKKYIGLGGEDKNALMAILESNISSEIKNLAGEKLLTQKLENDELFSIVKETTGEVQLKALKIFLRKSKNLDDRIELIEIENTKVAEIAWEKTLPMIMKKNPRERAEILFDILKYADSEKVKREAANGVWIIREILNEKELEQLYENADLITIEDPEVVKRWVDENILKMPEFEERGFEKIKEIIGRTKYIEIRERAIDRAIEEAEKEIAQKKFSNEPWNQERVEFLTKEIRRLRKEKESLRLFSEESPILA